MVPVSAPWRWLAVVAPGDGQAGQGQQRSGAERHAEQAAEAGSPSFEVAHGSSSLFENGIRSPL